MNRFERYLPIILLALAFTILLVTLNPFFHKDDSIVYRHWDVPSGFPVPSIIPTENPIPQNLDTKNWISYSSSKYQYAFKCPQGSGHRVELSHGNGKTLPLFQEICFKDDNQIRVFVYPESTSTDAYSADTTAFINQQTTPDHKYKIVLRGFSKSYFYQVLSTFQFTNSP